MIGPSLQVLPSSNIFSWLTSHKLETPTIPAFPGYLQKVYNNDTKALINVFISLIDGFISAQYSFSWEFLFFRIFSNILFRTPGNNIFWIIRANVIFFVTDCFSDENFDLKEVINTDFIKIVIDFCIFNNIYDFIFTIVEWGKNLMIMTSFTPCINNNKWIKSWYWWNINN